MYCMGDSDRVLFVSGCGSAVWQWTGPVCAESRSLLRGYFEYGEICEVV